VTNQWIFLAGLFKKGNFLLDRLPQKSPGNAFLPPTKNHVVSQFAFTLRPAALPALASVLILRLFFSASAQVNEKNQSSKEAQEKSS
jgi:hypothetical protein